MIEGKSRRVKIAIRMWCEIPAGEAKAIADREADEQLLANCKFTLR